MALRAFQVKVTAESGHKGGVLAKASVAISRNSAWPEKDQGWESLIHIKEFRLHCINSGKRFKGRIETWPGLYIRKVPMEGKDLMAGCNWR